MDDLNLSPNRCMLHIKDLKKRYDTDIESLEILKGINLIVNTNESVAITGESGSGKSTLLNMIGGLDNFDSGIIEIEGESIVNKNEDELALFRNRKIGFIFQQHYLLDEFNTLENVMIPYLINDFNKKEAKNVALELLNIVGLEKRINHYPNELSGGERQRVAIARAFINRPALILADEPTGNLDKITASKVLELLFSMTKDRLVKGYDFSLIIVTHSSEVSSMANRHYNLSNGVLNKVMEF
jgi:lipoprotein-releasing system ATP-binding protein